MDKISKNLLILKQLKINLKEVEAYDGYTKDEMIETFILKNGYNPVIEFKSQFDKLKTIIFKKLSKKIREDARKLQGKDIFSNLEEFQSFDRDLKMYLEYIRRNIEISLTESKSIKSFLFDFYFRGCIY